MGGEQPLTANGPRPRKDPALTRLLRTHRGKPIRRLWIDHTYGEEEITLLEEELIPAMEQFLARIQEIDAALEAA